MPSSSFECHESDHLAIFNAMLTFCATVKYISICNEVFHLKDLCSILIDLSPKNEEKEENIERYHRISGKLMLVIVKKMINLITLKIQIFRTTNCDL